MKFARIADLDTLCLHQENASYNVILLHGYGADFQDLASLHQVIKTTQPVNWFFPNAPLELNLSPMMTGRAWFPIDMAALEMAMMRGDTRYFADKKPKGMDEACEKLYSFLKEGKFDLSKTIIGGFSQGAMISSHTVLGYDLAIPLLIQFSGTLVGHELLKRTEHSSQLAVFQSHGSQDPVLPYHAALSLKDQLEKLCASVTFESFEGGHQIPYPVLNAVSHAINKIIDPKTD